MATRKLFQQAYEGVKNHMSEVLAVGAAGGCTITAALYARGRQRALDQARRNWSSKATGNAATAAEAEVAGATRQGAAAATQAVKKAPRYTYSSTEKFALALWHG